MDCLKLIPQFFYDLISRIIPGVACWFLFCLSMDSSLDEIFSIIFKKSSALQDSVFLFLLLLLFLAYLTSQVLVLFSHVVYKKIFKYFNPHPFQIIKKALSDHSDYSDEIKKYLKNQIKMDLDPSNYEKVNKLFYIWYDWLRIYYSDITIRCIKLRAELRMLSTMPIILFFSLLIHIYYSLGLKSMTFSWPLSLVFIILIVLFLGQYSRIANRFFWSVIHQYYLLSQKKKGRYKL